MTGRRWAVVGAGGMLGREAVRVLQEAGMDVVPLTRAGLDVTDRRACRAALEPFDVVLNAAAWTAVDAAEDHEAEAFSVNALGAAHLAEAAAAAGARLVHVSTDYVFDGTATAPYSEDAPTGPRSAYGRGKLAGEWGVLAAGGEHLVLRTAWLYGDGSCFPRTIARLLDEREEISVVDDQRGQPTWTRDVAELALALVGSGAGTGTYHATSGGEATWCELARAVAVSTGADPARVRPTTSANFPTRAERPAWSVLDHGATNRAGVAPIGRWEERWAAASESVLGAPGARATAAPIHG